MKTIIENGVMTNLYTDDEILWIKLRWIIIHAYFMSWHTYFYPRYTYSSEYGWLN